MQILREALTIRCCCALTKAGICDLQAMFTENVFGGRNLHNAAVGFCWIPLHNLFRLFQSGGGNKWRRHNSQQQTCRYVSPQILGDYRRERRSSNIARPTIFDVCMIVESHIKAQPNGCAAREIAPGTVLSSALSRAYGVCFWLHCLLLEPCDSFQSWAKSSFIKHCYPCGRHTGIMSHHQLLTIG